MVELEVLVQGMGCHFEATRKKQQRLKITNPMHNSRELELVAKSL